MKKIIKLTESDLERIIKRVLMENDSQLEPNTILLSKNEFCKSGLKLTYDGIKLLEKKPHPPILVAKISNAETFKNKGEKDFETPECVSSFNAGQNLVDTGQLINGFIESPFEHGAGSKLSTFVYDKNGKEVSWVYYIVDGAENLSNYIKSQKK